MIRVLFVALVASFLVSCAAEEVPVVSVPLDTKTIAVVTAIPNELRLGTEGITVFENHLDLVDITSWKLDDVAFGTIRAALRTKYHVIRAESDGTSFDSANDLFLKTPGIGDLVREHVHAAPGAVDVYMVIYASSRSHPYIQKLIVLQDIGVSKERVPIGEFAPAAHCCLMLAFVDGRNYKLLANTSLQMNPDRPSELGSVPNPRPVIL
ncbi:MAG TPA: hypothetical protein VGL35_11780 [Rhizomicrobium sp.]|jgi:hypothetical protein